MFKLKKIMAVICGLTLAATATMVSFVSASAAGAVGFGLSDGSKATTSTYNYINVDIFGLDDATFTTSGTIAYKVTKGVYSAAAKSSLAENGLYNQDEECEPTISVSFNTEYSDDYDLLTVTWYQGDDESGLYTTTTNHLVTVRLKFANGKAEATFTPFIDETTVIDIATDGSGSTETAYTIGTDVQYKLAADSNTVTVVADDPTPDPWVEATLVGNYTGESDSSIATAYKVTLTGDGETHNTITWKATTTDGAEKGHRTTGLSIGGDGSYSFGIAIGGVKTEAEGITKVEAALGALGN